MTILCISNPNSYIIDRGELLLEFELLFLWLPNSHYGERYHLHPQDAPEVDCQKYGVNCDVASFLTGGFIVVV